MVAFDLGWKLAGAAPSRAASTKNGIVESWNASRRVCSDSRWGDRREARAAEHEVEIAARVASSVDPAPVGPDLDAGYAGREHRLDLRR